MPCVRFPVFADLAWGESRSKVLITLLFLNLSTELWDSVLSFLVDSTPLCSAAAPQVSPSFSIKGRFNTTLQIFRIGFMILGGIASSSYHSQWWSVPAFLVGGVYVTLQSLFELPACIILVRAGNVLLAEGLPSATLGGARIALFAFTAAAVVVVAILSFTFLRMYCCGGKGTSLDTTASTSTPDETSKLLGARAKPDETSKLLGASANPPQTPIRPSLGCAEEQGETGLKEEEEEERKRSPSPSSSYSSSLLTLSGWRSFWGKIPLRHLVAIATSALALCISHGIMLTLMASALTSLQSTIQKANDAYPSPPDIIDTALGLLQLAASFCSIAAYGLWVALGLGFLSIGLSCRQVVSDSEAIEKHYLGSRGVGLMGGEGKEGSDGDQRSSAQAPGSSSGDQQFSAPAPGRSCGDQKSSTPTPSALSGVTTLASSSPPPSCGTAAFMAQLLGFSVGDDRPPFSPQGFVIEDGSIDIHYAFNFSFAFSYIYLLASNVLLFYLCLAFFVTLAGWLLLLDSVRAYVVTLIQSSVVVLVVRGCIHLVFSYYVTEKNLRIKHPRLLLFGDVAFSFTAGILVGTTQSLLRILYGIIALFVQASLISRPILPPTFALWDVSFTAYGSMLKLHHARLLHVDNIPPFLPAKGEDKTAATSTAQGSGGLKEPLQAWWPSQEASEEH